MEAFSDGVLAIIVTLLIFEIKAPHLDNLETATVIAEVWKLGPKFISFAISFFTVAIFWVNHHHFCHNLTHSDWKLLWYNNFLLFWLSVVPFTTAFIGDYPTQPLVVSLYAFVMFMAGLSFTLMGQYVLFKSQLVSDVVTPEVRRREWQRSWIGTGMYGLAAIIALLFVYAALLIIALIPIFYVVPGLVWSNAEAGEA